MKKYIEPQIDILYICMNDILTNSPGKDNGTDDDFWFDD